MPSESSIPITCTPAGDRDGDPSGADAELDYRPPDFRAWAT